MQTSTYQTTLRWNEVLLLLHMYKKTHFLKEDTSKTKMKLFKADVHELSLNRSVFVFS